MSLRTLSLAAMGCTLTSISMGACYVMVVPEESPPAILVAFFGGLTGGGGSLALAAFRLWNCGAPRAWPDVAQSTWLFLTGLAVTLGYPGALFLLDRAGLAPAQSATFFWAVLAVWFAAFAFTIGAMMLLFWAIRTDSKR